LKETQKLDRELGGAVIPYPFDNCAVIQKPFGTEGPKYRRIYKGHEVLFCCTPCVRAFDANPEPYMPRIMAAAKDRAAGTVTPPTVAQ
jgi:YHS domain-containing protein